MNLSNIKEKARAWWAGVADKKGVLIAVFLVLLFSVLLAVGPRTPALPTEQPQASPSQYLQDQIETLSLRVSTLEAARRVPEPDTQPPRASAPRAAVRPSAGTAAQPAPQRWGTTDIDRAIAAFPSTATQLEQAK